MAEDGTITYDREAQVAQVRVLSQEGHSMRSIVRQTGHSRNTVRRWLEQERPTEPEAPERDEAEHPTAVARSERSAAKVPPAPWQSWDEIREFSQALLTDKFLLVKKPEHRTAEEEQKLVKLLSYPGSDKLLLAKEFMGEWYDMWRDERGQRRRREEALSRYRAWQSHEEYRSLASLRRVQAKIDGDRFVKLSPKWEATNNGAERAGREFRHMQGPHFDLRTEGAIEGAIRAKALLRKDQLTTGNSVPVGQSNRGRRPQVCKEERRCKRALLVA